jgi:hypothetical protein
MEDKKALWGLKQKLLRDILLDRDKFNEAIALCLEQHAMIHSSGLSQLDRVTFEDELWSDLDEKNFRTMPTPQDETIAWNLWHLTRIEDIAMNILIKGEMQVINEFNWLDLLNISVCDTGNAMTDEEIIDLSSKINMQELRRYRMTVGRRTQEIIQSLLPTDLKKKMKPDRLQRILDEGGVLNVEGANWLIDFWGKKNVAGILLMPITRHQMVHMNESMRLKKKCQGKK